MRRKKLVHFSHNHQLHETDKKEEDRAACSCCRLDVIGPSFTCKIYDCYFLVHKSCTELPQHLHHKSHPAHALTLVPTPNFSEFLCSACGETGSGFAYNCSVCRYDIHVKCSSLPETVKREDHEHPVSLRYSMIDENDEVEFVCDSCDRIVNPGCWVYYCGDCDFGTHLDCAASESNATGGQIEAEKEEKAIGDNGGSTSGSYDPMALMNAQIKAQEQLQLNQMRMQTAKFEAEALRDMYKSMYKYI